jgi:ABC-type branched-subunit amino acid transport system substrate-binding protein
MKEMDVNFKYVTMSCTDIKLLEMVGAGDLEDFTSCTYTLGPAAEKVVPEIGAAFKAHFGRRMTDVDAMAVDQAMCVQAVLEAAKSTDPEEIRKAFYKIDYTGPAGRVKFVEQKIGGMTGMLTNQNPYAASLMIQWKNGQQVVVLIGPGQWYPTGIIPNEYPIYTYSQDWVEATIVYPMHTWSEKA